MRHSSSIPVEYCAKCSHIVENKYRLKYTPFAIRFKLHGYVLEITTGVFAPTKQLQKKKQHTILRIKKSISKMTQDQSLMRCKSHFQTTIFEHDTAQVTQHSVKLSK